MPEKPSEIFEEYEEADSEPLSEEERLTHEETRPIRDLLVPLENILTQLRSRIDAGEYAILLGDDASGRIPTLILGNVVKDVYRERRYAAPAVRFVAGSGRDLAGEYLKDMTWAFGGEEVSENFGLGKALAQDKAGMLAEYATRLKRELGEDKRKTLIVTDVVASGNSLEPLCDALREEKIDFEIATIGLANYSDTEGKDTEEQIKNHRANLEKKLHANIFFGEKGVPRIYNRPELAGVSKDDAALHAQALDSKEADMARSRREVFATSEELVRWYGEGNDGR